jgi:hypothetical protein
VTFPVGTADEFNGDTSEADNGVVITKNGCAVVEVFWVTLFTPTKTERLNSSWGRPEQAALLQPKVVESTLNVYWVWSTPTAMGIDVGIAPDDKSVRLAITVVVTLLIPELTTVIVKFTTSGSVM